MTIYQMNGNFKANTTSVCQMCSKLCLYLLLKLNHAYNYEFLFLSRLKLSTQMHEYKKNHYKTKNESLKVKDDSCFQVYSFTYYT